MIDEASRSAHVFTVDNITVIFARDCGIVVVCELVQAEKVRCFVWTRCELSFLCFGICNDFAEVAVDVLASTEVSRTAKAYECQLTSYTWLMNSDSPKPRFFVLKISNGTVLPFCTFLFLQFGPQRHF